MSGSRPAGSCCTHVSDVMHACARARYGNAVVCLAALCGWDTRARTASRAAEGLSLAAARARRVARNGDGHAHGAQLGEAPDVNRASGTTPQPGSGMPGRIRSPPAKAPGLQALSWLGRVRGVGAASTPQRSGWRRGDRSRRQGRARCQPCTLNEGVTGCGSGGSSRGRMGGPSVMDQGRDKRDSWPRRLEKSGAAVVY